MDWTRRQGEVICPWTSSGICQEVPSSEWCGGYEGVGHAVHWEQPERFAQDVAAFSRYFAGLQLSR